MYVSNVEMLEAVVAPDMLAPDLSGVWQAICDFCQGFKDGFCGK